MRVDSTARPTPPAAATANMKLGTHDYLIQPNWVNSASPHCGLTPWRLSPMSARLNVVRHG